MKALVFTDTQEVTYRDEARLEPAADEALIRVEAAGICGSDMHAYHGHDPRRQPPLILGHEAAGIVEQGRFAGKRVTMNPFIVCGQCDYCLTGRQNLCANRTAIGMTRPGAFAEYLTIPEHCLIELPQAMSPVAAAVTEPAATALHAVNLAVRAAFRPLAEGKTLVIGAGAVGLLTALCLKMQGVRDIVIADTNALRRATAARAGCGTVHDPLAGTLLPESGFDAVFDAVGTVATRKAAIDAVRPGGVIVHIGLQDWAGEFNARKLTLAEITFIGAFTYSMYDLKAAVAALHGGQLGDLGWVEERPLAEGAAAFADLHHGRTGAAKIVLRP